MMWPVIPLGSSTFLGDGALFNTAAVIENKARRKRVYIVDDHRFFVAGLSSLINHSGDLEVCGSASDERRLVGDIRRLSPDLVLLDVNLVRTSGLEVARMLRRVLGDIPILFISSLAEACVREEADRLGVLGYLEKTQEPGRILEGIRRALQGCVRVVGCEQTT